VEGLSQQCEGCGAWLISEEVEQRADFLAHHKYYCEVICSSCLYRNDPQQWGDFISYIITKHQKDKKKNKKAKNTPSSI